MIISAHHFTGFWFESVYDPRPEGEEVRATDFLTASLHSLEACGRSPVIADGAINTGYNPALLSPNLSGHRWLRERLLWMKGRFGENFDDYPENPKDPKKRRNPFPAFNWTHSYSIDGCNLPLDGVEVLIGHDYAVVHEFRIALPEEGRDGLTPTYLNAQRFAAPLDSSASLFTAHFFQYSGLEGVPFGEDWQETEFAAGALSEVNVPLRCAVRADERCYRGCVLVKSAAGQDMHSQFEEHLNASGYLTFFCTLLVNDAKVQYENDVTARELESLKRRLALRFSETQELIQAWYESNNQFASPALLKVMKRSPDTLKARLEGLKNAHLADRTQLDRFDQLVLTCRHNAEQFEEVVGHLLERDNVWAERVRQRLSRGNAHSREVRRSIWGRFDLTQAHLNLLTIAMTDSINSSETLEAAKQILTEKGLDKSGILMSPRHVFISYARKDIEWLELLKTHLDPLIEKYREAGFNESDMFWDDSRIKPGTDWMGDIKAALARAKAAILLVTPNFLASNFIKRHELPELLKAEEERGLLLLWIPVSYSSYEDTQLAKYHFLSDPKEPLDTLTPPMRNKALVRIYKEIKRAIEPTAD